MHLRWGIAGASKIAHDFCIAVKSELTTCQHDIVAIASRKENNAKEFAKNHKIPNAYGSYIQLAKDANVEVVYITVLNPQHYEVTKIMLENGKNVVCEKPFAMNYMQADELFKMAEEKNLFIMEGLWSRFFPVYRHLKNLLDTNGFDDIKELYIKHGFCGSHSERIVNKKMGGGIVLDIGCYALQLMVLVFQEIPLSIKAEGKINASGVDLFFEADIIFSNNRKAKIICSGLEELENQATIITKRGPICIPRYWCPTKYLALDELHEWAILEEVQEKFHYTNSIGLKYEADEVAKCIRAGQLHCDIVPKEHTLLIAKIQDEIRKQIGVQYDCD